MGRKLLRQGAVAIAAVTATVGGSTGGCWVVVLCCLKMLKLGCMWRLNTKDWDRDLDFTMRTEVENTKLQVHVVCRTELAAKRAQTQGVEHESLLLTRNRWRG
ncbi:hypothetical protein BU24DRAFT_288613 [Aaosphaeria arxii CBS 175.79]|uniref:Uncharacterized protein n=1 Tax=Aaosphaeria arxii CBS 175.79 TaxID=1450172 RepID=A0A6A5XEU0_9PLEO|nr:uncharacterized protein BU24DRAFT_288613 [Aaosphaeria arxii CBS 175.79]KAF2011755.1 hypothetical protein BU24DRAFT_288613 [Aaosphaeria arxii CBS 175.79]